MKSAIRGRLLTKSRDCSLWWNYSWAKNWKMSRSQQQKKGRRCSKKHSRQQEHYAQRPSSRREPGTLEKWRKSQWGWMQWWGGNVVWDELRRKAGARSHIRVILRIWVFIVRVSGSCWSVRGYTGHSCYLATLSSDVYFHVDKRDRASHSPFCDRPGEGSKEVIGNRSLPKTEWGPLDSHSLRKN